MYDKYNKNLLYFVSASVSVSNTFVQMFYIPAATNTI